MFLKLNNNPKLANPITGTIVDNIAGSIDKLFIKNCPLVDGYANLKKIYDVQSGNGSIVLSRVRVDIGNVSGSISELMQYSSMAGFNDAGEEQAKPRLVGTWTVNDWHTQEQLAAAQAAFDGLTVVGDNNYLINFDDLAVQVVDPNEDNYNPAVAIILQGQNLGTTIATAPLGHGRWFMTKAQAAAVTRLDVWSGVWNGMFTNKTTVSDSNNIIDGNSYDFVSFNELEQFVGLTTLGYQPFSNCRLLESITLPHQITSLPDQTFNGCTKLSNVNLTSITYYGDSSLKSSKINLSNIDNVTHIGSGTFNGCTNVTFTEIPANITAISENLNNLGTFAHTTGIPYLHFLSETPVTGILGQYAKTHGYCTFYGTTYKIYVGDGSSQEHDNTVLSAYQQASNWSGLVNDLDTWYNYLHPTT